MPLDAEDTAVETALHRGRDWKGYAAMILAVTGLVTAIFHKQPEDAAKTGYMELTTAILLSQEAERKNHEDVMAVREYLDTYIKSHESVITPVAVDAGALVPLQRIPIVAPGAITFVRSAAPADAAAPPAIVPLKQAARPRSVDSISW